MDLQLAGKVVLVAGASIGIGRTIARLPAEEGCRLAVLARRSHLLAAVADEIADNTVNGGGQQPLLIVEDVTAPGLEGRPIAFDSGPGPSGSACCPGSP